MMFLDRLKEISESKTVLVASFCPGPTIVNHQYDKSSASRDMPTSDWPYSRNPRKIKAFVLT
ncbi:MAG TPA: hypothetical protein VN084_05145 [Methylophilaceae bacterium]|nr:hypothetical protein [Methylophilaceae bacterium]